jgi:hypothetical protein
MMRSMTIPRPTERPNQRARGAAFDVCPRTPDCLVVEFDVGQVNYPICPKLKSPRIVEGFVVLATRDYYKKSITVKRQRVNDPYHYHKSEGLEPHFWCDFQKDMYVLVILRNKEVPIVPMKYIDWAYIEKMNDPSVNAVIAKFEDFKL